MKKEMKRIYEKPAMKVVQVRTGQFLLAGSLRERISSTSEIDDEDYFD